MALFSTYYRKRFCFFLLFLLNIQDSKLWLYCDSRIYKLALVYRLIFICNFGNVNEVPSLIAQLLFYFRNNRGFSLEINQPPGFYDVHSRC